MLAGGWQAVDAPVLGLLGCGRGTDLLQHRQHRLGLRSQAWTLLCLDLPPVMLRDTLLLLFGDEIQAEAAQD